MTAGGRELAYVDASAFAKLIKAEPESGPFITALESWPQLVAAEILEVEVMRLARRLGGSASDRAAEALADIVLVAQTAAIRNLAGGVEPTLLRTLDALHLATAMSLAERLSAFFVYDQRLTEAAAEAGLPVLAPG